MSDPRIEASARQVLARVINAGSHPDYDLLEAAVDGCLPEEQRVAFNEHLRWCGDCARELADLERYARGDDQPRAGSPCDAGIPAGLARERRLRRWLLALILALLLGMMWFSANRSATNASTLTPLPVPLRFEPQSQRGGQADGVFSPS